MAIDTSKTAKKIQKGNYPPAHLLNVNVLLSNIFYIYICCFITFLYLLRCSG